MDKTKLTTPILLMIFNRPETTSKIFEVIREAKPTELFIFADAPRADVKEDDEKCKQAREIIKQIDWNCELHTNLQNEHVGCDKAHKNGIDWFFENTDAGIILEDDCLVNQAFFYFCQEMLNYYKDDARIMHISGNNFLDGGKIGDASYYFSKEPLIWGWATWKRAWKLFNPEMPNFEEFKSSNQMRNIYNDFIIQKYRIFHFQKILTKNIPNCWDFKWLYTVYTQNGLCITPNVNLITNIGFCENSLHTNNINDRYANMKKFEIGEIVHPKFFIPNTSADIYTLKNHLRYGIKGIFEKIVIKMRSRLKKTQLLQLEALHKKIFRQTH